MMFGGGGGFSRNLALGSSQGMGGGPAQRMGLASSEEDFGKAFDPRVIGRLWRYAAPFKGRIALSVVFLVINSLATILTPLLPGLAINALVAKDETELYVICAAFLLDNTIVWLSAYQQVYQMTWVGQHALFRVSSDLFSHIGSLSLRFFDENETGRVMARMQNDVSVLQNTLSNGMISIFGSLIALVGILITLFVLNWELAALVSISVPVMAATLWIWQHYARRSFLQARATISAVNATIQENVSGVRVIQSVSRERINTRSFANVNDDNRNANVEAGRISAIVQPLVAFIAASAMAVAIFVGGGMVLDGTMQIGFLVSFTLYIDRFFTPIREMTQQYTNMQRATVAAERIFEILDWPQEVEDAPDAMVLDRIEGDVEFRDVRFGYAMNNIEVIKGLNLHIKPGEHVAIVGTTGAGKSTLISLLARFYDVYRRGNPGRRPRHPHRHDAVLAEQHGYRFAGPVHLPRHDSGQHHVREARRIPGRGRGRGHGCRPSRTHQPDGPRIQHASAARRREPQPRPASAHQPCARAAGKPWDPDAR